MSTNAEEAVATDRDVEKVEDDDETTMMMTD
jgi:hypothetical protein